MRVSDEWYRSLAGDLHRPLPSRMLISVHIPKCAGTSFRHVLEAVHGGGLWLNYGAIFTREQAAAGLVPAAAACIHGHFFADAFDTLYPGRRLAVWLRHPVERVVSNYHHFLRSPDPRDDCCRQLHERRLSLREFAALDWMRNESARYLGGKPLADFAFVGVAERFAESLSVCRRTFGWHTPVPLPCANTNPERLTDRYALSPQDFSHLLDLNEADLARYEEAVARLDDSVLQLQEHAA